MKILVTGGAGYIGSHACKVLAANGFEPIVYDNLSRGNRWAVKFGPLEVGDLGDTIRLQAVLEKYRPQALMHFAAFAYVGESVANPLLYYRNNIGETTSLLQAIVNFQPMPVVFSSTCATYGVPDVIPIPEDHPQRPINPYGYSKLVVERLLADLDIAHNLRSVSLRYFDTSCTQVPTPTERSARPMIPNRISFRLCWLRPATGRLSKSSGMIMTRPTALVFATTSTSSTSRTRICVRSNI